MIGKGVKLDNLYILDAVKLKTNATNLSNTDANLETEAITFVNNVSTQVWHNRLGHLSIKRLDILKNQIHCNTSRFNKDSVPCYICPLAKQRRLSFVSFNHMAQCNTPTLNYLYCVIKIENFEIKLNHLICLG